MLLRGKFAAPINTPFPHPQQALARLSTANPSLIIAPAGYLMPEALATALRERSAQLLWVRVGPEDADPGMLVALLATAARSLSPGLGEHTLGLLRRPTGRLDWPAVFLALADEIAGALGKNGALVLEGADQLSGGGAWSLVAEHFLPALDGAIRVLVAHRALPRSLLPRAHHTSPLELRLSADQLFAMAEAAEADLPHDALRRALGLLDGGVDRLYSLLQIAVLVGNRQVARAIEQAKSGDDLLVRAARLRLAAQSPEVNQSLSVAATLGFCHPQLSAGSAQPPKTAARWLLPLADGWTRLRDPWEPIITRALPRSGSVARQALHQAADRLADQAVVTAAVPLYLDLGAYNQAAALISASLDQLMAYRLHQTLRSWLERLPMAALHERPWLLMAQGEIAADEGDLDRARRSFAAATARFAAANTAEGVCQSQLARSTVALWQGDRGLARHHSLDALAGAKAANLAWQTTWATWQLIDLSYADHDVEAALTYLDHALALATQSGQGTVLEVLHGLHAMLTRRRTLRERREFHRRSYLELTQAEGVLEGQVQQFLDSPQAVWGDRLSGHDWASTPLLLKLRPAELGELALPATDKRGSALWRYLSDLFKLLRPADEQPRARQEEPWAETLAAGSLADELTIAPRIDQWPAQPEATPPHGAPAQPPAAAAPSFIAVQATPGPPSSHKRSASGSSRPTTLQAKLLGSFQISLGGRSVESWPSGRGRSLLKYLLAHRERPIAREVLLEQFWPEASPEDGRNNLNVAMHGLRQALRAITDLQVVIYLRNSGSYRLNPELSIATDVQLFEDHVQEGHRYEAGGQLDQAAYAYEQAAQLYLGDFLEEDLYEDWPALRREQLRLAHLDALDRLSRIRFGQGQYAAAASVCQQTLAHDTCREDAHCRLMRCFARQGHTHLALEQYQSCVRALADHLGVDPLPGTTELAERIRRREEV